MRLLPVFDVMLLLIKLQPPESSARAIASLFAKIVLFTNRIEELTHQIFQKKH